MKKELKIWPYTSTIYILYKIHDTALILNKVFFMHIEFKKIFEYQSEITKKLFKFIEIARHTAKKINYAYSDIPESKMKTEVTKIMYVYRVVTCNNKL